MLGAVGYFVASLSRGVADRLITSPVYRWTWRPFSDETFVSALPEIRPADPPSATDMVAGKYLLGSRLVETGGVSPFSVPADDREWLGELHSFAWLRHFTESRDPAERRFARTLVLDWIGRFGNFDRRTWQNDIAARRILNWLRHLDLLTGDAKPNEKSQILRALSGQVQALRQRAIVDGTPAGRLHAAIALLGVALCQPHAAQLLEARAVRLREILGQQIDEDGLHRSRNSAVQYDLLTELAPVRLALLKVRPEEARQLADIVELMHGALSDMTLTTGEPGYFNGCGQLPLEMLLAVQSRSAMRTGGNSTKRLSGYGIARLGRGKVVVDGGLVPALAYSNQMHAGVAAFEYSCGNELVVCNCGPAPAVLEAEARLFRRTAAQSCVSIGGAATGRFGAGGLYRDRLVSIGEARPVGVDPVNSALEVTSDAFKSRFGVMHRRTLSLDADGQTLVGQDLLRRSRPGPAQPYVIRFHLGPGATAERGDGEAVIRIQTQSGDPWVFLWEAAEATIEPSVRQSAYFGLYDTWQIVLSGALDRREEIAWTFTRQFG
ncbi:MAG: hypothetical protein GXP01_06070 [Alphaproteobacteria bacterium]|nr:hypothetical protein [Alphaproteobacteria bacterium]